MNDIFFPFREKMKAVKTQLFDFFSYKTKCTFSINVVAFIGWATKSSAHSGLNCRTVTYYYFVLPPRLMGSKTWLNHFSFLAPRCNDKTLKEKFKVKEFAEIGSVHTRSKVLY